MKKLMRFLRSLPGEFWILALLLVVVALAVVLVVALLRAEAADEAKWKVFRDEHHCRVVARQDGYETTGSGVAITPKGGVAPVFTSNYVSPRATWRCDDGIDYTRDE